MSPSPEYIWPILSISGDVVEVVAEGWICWPDLEAEADVPHIIDAPPED